MSDGALAELQMGLPGVDAMPAPPRCAGEPGLVFPVARIVSAGVRWYRESGFPYRALPPHECMRQINALAAQDARSLLASRVAYQVADTYHHHRMGAAAFGMRSPVAAFNDDAALGRAIALACEHGKDIPTVLNIVSGTQACSNFRPGYACALYRELCPEGGTVLDTSTGYGGRLVGFMASRNAARYVGIDPSRLTHDANERMARDMGFSDRVRLINKPAEDVALPDIGEPCDFAFTSPPYFAKELYSDEPTQSWRRYPRPREWRAGFLRPMLRLTFDALRPGCAAVVNVADVTVGRDFVPLVEWTIADAVASGFVHVETRRLARFRRVGGKGDAAHAAEPVLVFRKPLAALVSP